MIITMTISIEKHVVVIIYWRQIIIEMLLTVTMETKGVKFLFSVVFFYQKNMKNHRPFHQLKTTTITLMKKDVVVFRVSLKQGTARTILIMMMKGSLQLIQK